MHPPTVPYVNVFVSSRDLPQQGTDNEPVKRPDDCKIDFAKQIMRQHQRGRCDALAVAGGCYIHDHTKIQMFVVEPGN